MPFLPGVYIADIGPPRNTSAPMVVQSPYYIRTYSCSCVVQILHCVSLHARGMMRHPLSCTWIMCPSLSGAAGVPAVTDTAPADTAQDLSQRVAHAVSTGGPCNPFNPSLHSQPTSVLSLQDCMEDRENTADTNVGLAYPAVSPLDMGPAYPAVSPLDMGLA